MSLYKLFSCNVEIQYKSYFLSKAMLFTLITTTLTIILPFFIAYRSRGFWLRTHKFYEQPEIRFTYEYILIAETEDPSHAIICGESSAISREGLLGDENCVKFQVGEHDNNRDGKIDVLEFQILLNVPNERQITSIIGLFALDFQLKTICPIHMQSLVVVDKSFTFPSSALNYYGDINFYQTSHLVCLRNTIDTKYNVSVLNQKQNGNKNIVDSVLQEYFKRQVITKMTTLYSRIQNGQTGRMNINLHIRVPEMQIRNIPSLLQEFRWVWPQYFSFVFIFYWIFNKIKRFVFNNRLLMAWEVVPWKKS